MERTEDQQVWVGDRIKEVTKGGVCVCVQSSGYKLGAVRLEIPISSAQFVGIPSIP